MKICVDQCLSVVKNAIRIEHVLIGKTPILTSFYRCKFRKNSEIQVEHFLSSSAATALYILIKIKGQQQINRTWLINLVNFRRFSEKFRFQFFIEQFLFSLSRSAPLPAGSYRLAHALRRVRAIGAERRRQPVASEIDLGRSIGDARNEKASSFHHFGHSLLLSGGITP
jgi:hypothetical protein